MKNWNKFCYVFSFLVFFTPSLKAQMVNPPAFQTSFDAPVRVIGGCVFIPGLAPAPTIHPLFYKNLQKNDNWSWLQPLPAFHVDTEVLPADYYTANQHAFFCRMEMKLEKFKEVPFQVRVRVGSLQANDWLEQKPNAIAPGQ
jgi:hypothetical protein